ncbi:MAG TPA: chorismate-binding protein [Candidatus Lustribacter sp.]|nr:chorismate-binding protein [Candidatus Lustribacter sp.]
MDVARFGTREARRVVQIRYGAAALDALDTTGLWAVVATFEGEVVAAQLADVSPVEAPVADPAGWAPLDGSWSTTLDATAYRLAVQEVRGRVAAGAVYQSNICRVMTHPLSADADLGGLAALLRQGNPAPYASRVKVAEADLDIVCASPELFLSRRGTRLASSPVKGTAAPGAPMLDKDYAENVMITDLVRNDLSHVCLPGTVDVEVLCGAEDHPGLSHLVTTVAGRLRPDATWAKIFAATFPPGSVSGAPKSSALRAIADLEPGPRGPYCGAVGWVDADTREAELAVGIRTFWAEHDISGRRWLRFGTGAGITWGSDPQAEWEETELKARRLVALASGHGHGALTKGHRG